MSQSGNRTDVAGDQADGDPGTGPFSHLIATARILTTTTPRETDPFRRLAEMLKESGDIAAQITRADCETGVDHGSRQAFVTSKLADELTDLMLAAAGLALDFGIVDLLTEAIRDRYILALDETRDDVVPPPLGTETGSTIFAVLVGTVRLLTAKYPSDSGPYQRLAKIYEEGGEVAEQIHIFNGSGIKRQKHGEFQPAKLAAELSDVMRAAVGMAYEFDIFNLVGRAIQDRYMRAVEHSRQC